MKLKRLWFSVSLIILLTMALLCGKKGDNSALQNFAMIDFLAQAAGGELFCAPVDLSTYRATNGFTSVLKVASGATNLQCVLCVK
jgi:hypothetical protein